MNQQTYIGTFGQLDGPREPPRPPLPYDVGVLLPLGRLGYGSRDDEVPVMDVDIDFVLAQAG